MSRAARGGRAVVLAASLALIGSSGVLAQSAAPAAPEPIQSQDPRVAARCLPREGTGGDDATDQEATAGNLPIAAVDPLGDPGCSFPMVDAMDPFTRQRRSAVLFTDVGRPGLIQQVQVFETDLSRGELRRITRQRGTTTAGRPRPGAFTGVVIDHGRIADDTGVNILTDLDRDPFDDTPTDTRNPDSPLAGGDGLYTVFGGGRAFVTDFPGEFYAGDVGRHPFVALRTAEQTGFLIPSDGVGTTVTPSIFADRASHYIDILPNGALPLDSFVSLFPGCLSQDILHRPLLVGGEPGSVSTKWVTACFPIEEGLSDQIGSGFIGPDPLPVAMSLVSFDPAAPDGRPQETYAEVSVGVGTLYVRFPSALFQYGNHRDALVVFEPTGDPVLDAVLGAAAATLDEYMVPVSVNEAEGLIQGMGQEPCLPPGEQEREPVG